MRQNSISFSIVAAALISFLGAGVASADFAISGEWFENRGPTVNIPPGKFDGPCAPATAVTIPFTKPIPAGARVNAPCVRHQDPGFVLTSGGVTTSSAPPVALAVVPQSGIPAIGQTIVAPTTNAAALGTGNSIRIPASIFGLNGSSQIPVPNNPVVQQLDTTFIFNGPSPLRTPTPNSSGGQNPGIAAQTRLMQPNAWSGAGQASRLNQNFNIQQTDAVLGITRRVTYTTKNNSFGGTMGMLLNGVGTVYVVSDLVTAVPGNEVLISPLGNAANPFITVHMGRGYNSTQMRAGNSGLINLNYGIPVTCTSAIPPAPLGCGLLTGISGQVAALPPATTLNIGFPWTTGHVSAYAKGVIGGVPQTSTLTAQGGDSFAGGVRTIQLVAGGMALRNSPASGLGRTPHLDVVTVQVPEPASTMALVGALGLIGGLYGVRRKLF